MALCIAQSAWIPHPAPSPTQLPDFRPTHATCMSVPWPVCDEKQRQWAVEILDKMRPGHSLGARGFVAWDITEEADARALAAFLTTVDIPVGFDFETHGYTPKGAMLPNLYGGETATNNVSPLHPLNKAIPAAFQLSWGRDTYLVRGPLLRHFAAWLMSKAKVDYAHAGMEISTCENVGFVPQRVHRDCLDMDFALAETTRQNSHKLKDITKDYLGLDVLHFKDLMKKGDKGPPDYEVMLERDYGLALEYASCDPITTTFDCDILQHLLEQEENPVGGGTRFELYMRMERSFHRIFPQIESWGVPVSQAVAKRLDEAIQEKVHLIDDALEREFGKGFSPESNKDVAGVLYGTLALPVRRTTASFYCMACGKQVSSRTHNLCRVHGRMALVNRESVDEEVLSELAEEGLPVAKKIAERRSLAKVGATWLDPLYRLTWNGYANPSIRSNYVVSGRLSGGVFLTSPKDIREVYAFEDESEDPLVMGRYDYAQLELRMLGHLAADATMMNAFLTGKDLHCYAAGLIMLLRECPDLIKDVETAERYYREVVDAKRRADLVKAAAKAAKAGTPHEAVAALTKRELTLIDLRDKAKAVNFGIAYGMSPARYARAQGVTMAEAQSLFDLIWSLYSDVPPYYERSIKVAKEAGGLYTLLGRHKELPELASSNPATVAAGERLVKNVPCQGGAGDVLRCAMIAIMVDIEAGSPPTPSGIGMFGEWVDGEYRLDYSRLPIGWERELPRALQHDLGLLGRLGVKLMLQVHDELLFAARKSKIVLASPRIRELMEHPFGGALELRVPLEVSEGWARNWKDAA